MTDNGRTPGPPLLTCGSCGAVFSGRPGDPCPRCGTPYRRPVGLPFQARWDLDAGWGLRGQWATFKLLCLRPREAFLSDYDRSRPAYPILLTLAANAYLIMPLSLLLTLVLQSTEMIPLGVLSAVAFSLITIVLGMGLAASVHLPLSWMSERKVGLGDVSCACGYAFVWAPAGLFLLGACGAAAPVIGTRDAALAGTVVGGLPFLFALRMAVLSLSGLYELPVWQVLSVLAVPLILLAGCAAALIA